MNHLQAVNTRNFEILQINKETKTALNGNFKRYHFARAHTYLQEIKSNLNRFLKKLLKKKKLLNETFNDNVKRIKKLENKCLDKTYLLEILESNKLHSGKTSGKEVKISRIKTKQKVYKEHLKHIKDKSKNKQKMLQTIKFKIETIQDKIVRENQNLEMLKDENKVNMNLSEETTRAREKNNK